MERIKELVDILSQASKSYYAGQPTMDDHDYDKLEAEYFELTGKRFAIVEDNKGAKFKHVWHGKSCRAKSLDKTKDTALLQKKFNEFTGCSNQAVLMWKLDGSTIQLYYKRGKLIHAVTRGTDGEEGVIIDHNAPFIHGIPQEINSGADYAVIRGEALMSYEEFNRIAEANPDEDYANPRNLATATISMDNPDEGVKVRRIDFRAFSLVMEENEDGNDLRPKLMSNRLERLSEMGFIPVGWHLVDLCDLEESMANLEAEAEGYDFPVDGEVVAYNDAYWAEKQPGTEHNPHISVGYALKWADELAETTLRNITWNTTRTGKINPVAEFDTVNLEGTDVSRATLHNVSFIKDKDIRVGDRILVYKANKIIPKVDCSLTSEQRPEGATSDIMDVYNIPRTCPCCGAKTKLMANIAAITLECSNPDCDAKAVDKLVHFCSKKGMDIEGLSEAKVEYLFNNHYIDSFYSIYRMATDYKRFGKIVNDQDVDLTTVDGWGETSVKNMVEAIDKSRHTSFIKFVTALGIPNIGRGQAKLLKEAIIKYHKDAGDNATYVTFNALAMLIINDYDFEAIKGIGSSMVESLKSWAKENLATGYYTMKGKDFQDLLASVMLDSDEDIIKTVDAGSLPLDGMTFVVTGSVEQFTNRKELSDFIESKGGKVSGSVSAKTSYLINNDTTSESGKNKKAKELGIKIISEQEAIDLAGGLN